MSGIASHLSHIIESSPFNISDSKREEIANHLEEQAIECKDVKFENDGSPQCLWTRINVLLLTIKSWETDGTYRDFVEKFRKEWRKLIEDCELHEEKAIRCFRLGCIAGDDEKLISALKDCRHHYAEQLTGLLIKLSDFLGRGIAQCNHTPEAKRSALQTIGFDAQVTAVYTFDQITAVFLMVLVATIVIPIIINFIFPANDHSPYLQPYMFKIAFSYACASLIALYSFHHKKNPELPGQNRPWGRYLLIGLSAAALAMALGIVVDVFNLVIHSNYSKGLGNIITDLKNYGWVYQIRTLVLGIVLSYLLDTPARSKPRRQQWFETAFTGAVMLGTGYIIKNYFNSAAVQSTLSHQYALGMTFLILSLVLGGLVGYWLPTNVRHTQETAHEPDNQAQTPSTAVVN
jgi:hypothetical protein